MLYKIIIIKSIIKTLCTIIIVPSSAYFCVFFFVISTISVLYSHKNTVEQIAQLNTNFAAYISLSLDIIIFCSIF